MLNQVMQSQCSCANVQIDVKGKALTRFYCHCQICQDFNGSAFSDVVVFSRKDVVLRNKDAIDFSYLSSPKLLARGKCKQCDQPVCEDLPIKFFGGFYILPRAMLPADFCVPEAEGHIFYHRKVNKINDSLPKLLGFLASQLFTLKIIFFALLKA